MSTYKIQVQVFSNEAWEWQWRFGRRSTGEEYEFPTREQAEQALRLWSDEARLPLRVRIVEVDL